MTFIKFC